jgi:hypothetical protein
MTYNLFSYTAFFLSLFLGNDNIKNQHIEMCKRITVIGIALNDKDAAIVRTVDNKYYILDGVDEWDEKYYHKKVKVTGKLKIEVHDKKSTDSIQVQERVGKWLIIKKPRWALVE